MSQDSIIVSMLPNSSSQLLEMYLQDSAVFNAPAITCVWERCVAGSLRKILQGTADESNEPLHKRLRALARCTCKLPLSLLAGSSPRLAPQQARGQL
jgi:hypothetical protein